jgi:hypothetical protein
LVALKQAYFQIVAREDKAAGLQRYENIKAQELSKERARTVVEKAVAKEKCKLETMLAQHESRAIADQAYQNAIANSPAKALVEKHCDSASSSVFAGSAPDPAQPAVGSHYPGCADGLVERGLTRRGTLYFHCSTFMPGAPEQRCNWMKFFR